MNLAKKLDCPATVAPETRSSSQEYEPWETYDTAPRCGHRGRRGASVDTLMAGMPILHAMLPLVSAALTAAVVGCSPVHTEPLQRSLPSTSSSSLGASHPPPTAHVETSSAPSSAAGPPDPKSPFTTVTQVDLALPGYSAYNLEGTLLAQSQGRIVELVEGVAKPRPDLSVGLSTDPCDRLSGLVGRFPDAAFALTSRGGMACGTMFGTHRIYRWTGREWSALPRPPTDLWGVPRWGFQYAARAGVGLSQGPGIVICEVNEEAGSCGRYALLGRVPRGASTPMGRMIQPLIQDAFFRFAPSGMAVSVGNTSDGESTPAIERWMAGRLTGVVARLPLPCASVRAGLYPFADTDIAVAVSCRDDPEPHVLHFDGRSFLPLSTPAKAPITALTGERDGTLWLSAASKVGSAVYRRSPKGVWSRVPLPRADATDPTSPPFAPEHLIVRRGEVWAIAANALYAPQSAFDDPSAKP